MNKVYYNQCDPRWANHPYPSPSLPNATIGSGGCGVTCAAMVISSSKETIYPDAMGDISMENGYRVDGGTSDGLFFYIADRWGLEIEQIHSSYDALDYCKRGYFVVMCCAEGLWTTGGHFILAVGGDGDRIEIYDPYLYAGKFDRYGREGKVDVEGYSCWVQIDTFKEYSNVQRLYAIKVEGVEPSPAPTPTTKTMYVNTQSLNLNVRSGAGQNYPVIGSLPKGTQVTVYGESNGWSNIGEGQWVSSAYLSDTPPSSYQPRTKYVSVRTSLNVRAGAGTNYAVIGRLSNGDAVTVYEESNGWSRIGDGRWVCSDYLVDSLTVTKTVRVRTALNIRSGAGTGYPVVGTLHNGDVVTVYETSSNWSRIGNGQWVCSDYLV